MLRLDKTRKSFREVALSSLGLACPFDMLWQTTESPYFLHESCSLGKLRSVAGHSCEFGLVFDGQAAGFSGLVKSFRKVALSSLGRARPFHMLWHTSQSLYLQHERGNFVKLRSVDVHSCEFGLVVGGQAAGVSGLL